MKEGIALLRTLGTEWSTATNVPEVDWSRLRTLEFQEILQTRKANVSRLTQKACVLCESFSDHVSCPRCLCLTFSLMTIAVFNDSRGESPPSKHRKCQVGNI